VQAFRKKGIIVVVVIAVIAVASKYYALSGIERWSLDLVHAVINLFLTIAMISIPVYFLQKAESTKVRAASSRLMGFAIAFTIFMFYVLLFIVRLIMMMEYYATNSTMLTLELLFMGLVLVALIYPVIKQGKQEGVKA
jgi:hypothetical protein